MIQMQNDKANSGSTRELTSAKKGQGSAVLGKGRSEPELGLPRSSLYLILFYLFNDTISSYKECNRSGIQKHFNKGTSIRVRFHLQGNEHKY